MNTNLSVSLGSCVLAVLLTACSKPADTAPAVSSTPPPAAAPAASTTPTKSSVDVQAEQSVTQVVKTPPVPETPVATTPASPQLQATLDRAKTLFNEKKYPEALATLAELSNVSLSAEQQRMVDSLKTQVQNAMASQTANEGLKAVGGLLNQKK
jgi:hypothetical protein